MVLGNFILTLQSEKERAAYVTREISVEDKKVRVLFQTYAGTCQRLNRYEIALISNIPFEEGTHFALLVSILSPASPECVVTYYFDLYSMIKSVKKDYIDYQYLAINERNITDKIINQCNGS